MARTTPRGEPKRSEAGPARCTGGLLGSGAGAGAGAADGITGMVLESGFGNFGLEISNNLFKSAPCGFEFETSLFPTSES